MCVAPSCFSISSRSFTAADFVFQLLKGFDIRVEVLVE